MPRSWLCFQHCWLNRKWLSTVQLTGTIAKKLDWVKNKRIGVLKPLCVSSHYLGLWLLQNECSILWLKWDNMCFGIIWGTGSWSLDFTKEINLGSTPTFYISMRSTELKKWNDIAKFKGDSWFEEKVIQKFRWTMDLRPS